MVQTQPTPSPPLQRALARSDLPGSDFWTQELWDMQYKLIMQGGGGTIEKRQWIRYVLHRLEAPPSTDADDTMHAAMRALQV